MFSPNPCYSVDDLYYYHLVTIPAFMVSAFIECLLHTHSGPEDSKKNKPSIPALESMLSSEKA